MRRMALALAVLALAVPPAWAKDMLFWNQTTHEFSGVYLAPAGSGKYGPNQTDNDPDHAVSGDERLTITGVAPGRYDVKLVEELGRTCIVAGVEVKVGGRVAFAVAEADLTHCVK